MPFKPKEKAFPKAVKLFRAAEANAATLSITCTKKTIKSTNENLREAIARVTHEFNEICP